MQQHSATLEVVNKLVADDLSRCDAQQIATFQQYAVQPYLASIVRHGNIESVVVVARRGNEVIYWEDVEEGFNASPIDAAGRILEHWCSQDELGLALNGWIEGRRRPPGLGPAVPIL
jgi:hypothetical protein